MNTEMDNLQNADGEQLPKSAPTNDSNTETYKTEESSNQEKINDISFKDYETFSFDVLINEAKNLLSKYDVQDIREHFNQIREAFKTKLEEDEAAKKEAFLNDGGDELDFKYETSFRAKFNAVYNDFKNQLAIFHKENEKKESDNLKERSEIIDELKALYQEPSDSSAAMFKKFRELKTRWHNAGRVPSKNAENIFKNYFFHLDNFYTYLDMNKELQTLDYAHNLEVRYSIIKRAEELVQENNVQKALNELQYLHRLWKEEAVPVQEDLREPTWLKFKELTNKIHDRKGELNEKIKQEQKDNLEKKNQIIARIKEIASNSTNKLHSDWQKAIKEVNTLREQFITLGRVPKEKNSATWEAFKEVTREFNHIKNDFYKDLKSEQQVNLEKKLALLEIAKQHTDSTDWNKSVQVIKKIQNDWKKIGHVPRKNSDKIWKEFKDTCNQFFDRYKKRHEQANEKFEQNFVNKQAFLENFKNQTISEDKEEALKQLEEIQNSWTNLGKVPSDKTSINQEFTDVYHKKLDALNLSKNELNDYKLQSFVNKVKSGNNGNLLDDEIRKTRKAIEDLEKEINQLDNNVHFFSNADKNSPLLKDVYRQIDEKRKKLTEAEIKLKTLFNIDFNA
ncbi:DUF349 domain-containing protein [Empedobacter brevis]|uniref:DUF349 domain-containing protein n=1 Tax=Empedobacter brevis NBRC 14943 = ATCC 43319 TaxID=1218108 RepID=A0A511NG33_9FLAO|nr:DUF349 domain-containing protein [Empedobacter brevis]QES93213.1 DUF349 domain-containing protein [Empedobacter brevis]GEM51773.1 hypothetical protein EB1_15630 [Empedobacter brevis NBRC 14943 = ATCC 43319]